MKLLKFILISAFFITAFISCKPEKRIVFETDIIYFSKEGGSEVVRLTKGGFDEMDIYEISGTNYPPYGDDGFSTEYLKRDWIELTKIESDETTSLAITASPNTSGTDRYAIIRVGSANDLAYIKVYQE